MFSMTIQAWLMYGAYNAARKTEDNSGAKRNWRSVLRFTTLFSPAKLSREQRSTISGAQVNDHHLLILVREDLGAGVPSSEWPTELVDVDLKAKTVSSVRGPDGMRYVVCADNEVWFLPEAEGGTSPFVFEGAVWSIALRASTAGAVSRREVKQFVDLQWRGTGRVVESPSFGMGSQAYVGMQGDRSFWIQDAAMGLYYRSNVQPLHESMFGRTPNGVERKIVDDGALQRWKFIPIGESASTIGSKPIGYWLQNGRPCSLEVDLPRIQSFDLVFRRFLETGDRVTESYVCPIPWSQHELLRFQYGDGCGGMHTIPSDDGTAYLICLNGVDGRLHVLKVGDQEPHIICQRGSRKVNWLILDGFCFVLFVWCLPVLPLLAFMCYYQSHEGQRVHRVQDRSAVLATTWRRGIARAIDLLLMSCIGVGAIVSHPDFIGWWIVVCIQCDLLFDSFLGIIGSWRPEDLAQLHGAWVSVIASLLNAPVENRMATAAVCIASCQLVMMAKYGQTLGKKICGVKVVRACLLRCALWRILVREAMLLIGTVGFAVWWPGLLVMFVSSKSQRVGDIAVDTIVISNSLLKNP